MHSSRSSRHSSTTCRPPSARGGGKQGAGHGSGRGDGLLVWPGIWFSTTVQCNTMQPELIPP